MRSVNGGDPLRCPTSSQAAVWPPHPLPSPLMRFGEAVRLAREVLLSSATEARLDPSIVERQGG